MQFFIQPSVSYDCGPTNDVDLHGPSSQPDDNPKSVTENPLGNTSQHQYVLRRCSYE